MDSVNVMKTPYPLSAANSLIRLYCSQTVQHQVYHSQAFTITEDGLDALSTEEMLFEIPGQSK